MSTEQASPVSDGVINSLTDILERVARDTIRDRMRTWRKYEFEKHMLPSMLAEVERGVRVELITNANVPEEIILKVRFEKTEISHD